MRPKIELCPVLAHYRLPQDKAGRYQFKFYNSRRRPAANIEITVSAIIPGLIHPESIKVLKIDKRDVGWMEKHGATRFRVTPPHMAEATFNSFRRYLPQAFVSAMLEGAP